MVQVIHGANDRVFDVTGVTVASVQASLSDAYNIPPEAFAYINGKIVGEGHRLLLNDVVEFILQCGTKGAAARKSTTPLLPIKTPFPYTGGKSSVAPEVWRRFGDVKNYVEPFFGGGGVLLNRPVWGGNRIETSSGITPCSRTSPRSSQPGRSSS